MPKFFDVHSHVNLAAFSEDRGEAIRRALGAGVWHANVGTQRDTSAEALRIAEKYEEGVYAIVGLHPVHTSKSFHDEKELGPEGKAFTSRGEVFDEGYYRALADHPKVVAIGECGLDYYRLEEDTKEKQKQAFIEQIEMANALRKPLMLHVRNAYRDAAEIIRAHAKVPGNVHFFSGTWDEAKQFLDLGFTLSFTGVVTFARDYDEVVKNAPLESILSETDAPYITPVPLRGQRNEPRNVEKVARKIAEIRGEPYDKVRGALLKNALRLFGLPLVLDTNA